MFDQTFVGTEKQAHRPWTMAASLTVQTVFVGLVLLIPLLHPEGPLMKIDAPPIIYRSQTLVELPTIHPMATTAPRVSRVFNLLMAPRTVPTTIAQVNDAPEISSFSGALPGTMPGAIASDSFIATLPERTQPVPPKPAIKVETPQAPTTPVRVSTSVQSALLIFGPKPIYPALGKAARVQGTVRITAIIGKDGAISNLKLISGPPLLVSAALEAVSRWRYRPTMLNGSPVEVVTEVDVNFTLAQ